MSTFGFIVLVFVALYLVWMFWPKKACKDDWCDNLNFNPEDIDLDNILVGKPPTVKKTTKKKVTKSKKVK